MVQFGTTGTFPVGGTPLAVAAADFDRDGNLDLATVVSSASQVSLLLGDGTGDFGDAALVEIPVGSVPNALVVGDFNGDRSPDVAVSVLFEQAIVVLLGNGDGSFGAATTTDLGRDPLSLTLSDFDRDGNLDLATLNSDATFSAVSGLGNGVFLAPSEPEEAGGFTGAIAASDFDNDGRPDLIVANTDGTARVVPGLTPDVGNAPFPSVPNSSAIATGDFDGDGNLDAAVVNTGEDSVRVLLGLGNGNFAPDPLSVSVGDRPQAVVTVDFDGDGNLDLAAVNSGTNDVSVLLGDGTGAFALDTTLAVGNAPEGIAAGDFNNDTIPDLLVSNRGGQSVSVLLQSNSPPEVAGISFSVAENAAVGTAIGTVAASDPEGETEFQFAIASENPDLDGDGTPALTISQTGELAVFDSDDLDFESASEFSLTVTATDRGGLSGTGTVTVTVSDRNEAPEITGTSVIPIEATPPVGTAVGTVTAIDPDAGDRVSFAIVGGNPGGALAIADSGEITVAAPDAVQPDLVLTVAATDEEGLQDTVEVAISVDTEANDPPTVQAGSGVVSEDSPVGTAVGTAIASDPEGDAIAWTLDPEGNPDTDADGDRAFAIDPSSGEISVADADELADVSVFELSVTATDDGDPAASGSGNFRVEVTAGFNLDLDGNGEATAFSDGLILFRFLAGLAATTFESALSPDATRSAEAIAQVLTAADSAGQLDFDGDGEATAFNDGLIGFRFLAGLSAGTFESALGDGATRSVSEIETLLEGLNP